MPLAENGSGLPVQSVVQALAGIDGELASQQQVDKFTAFSSSKGRI
jgi:hypothetical protein